MSKAQASTEMLIVLAIFLIVFLGIFVSNQQNISNINIDFEITKAKIALDSIENAANLVYQQGEGAKTKAYVNFPRNIKSTLVNNQTITIQLYAQSEIDIYRNFDFTVNGTLPESQGNHWISIQSRGSTVFIGNVTIPAAHFCGNNIQEGPEECDGIDLVGESCISKGYDNGTLSCSGLCAYKYSGCNSYSCGNGITDPGEVCDNADLNDQFCFSLGYLYSGPLSCLSNCSNYNFDNCKSEPDYWEINLWELGTDIPHPLDFTSGLNSTANTFWPSASGADDGWDWHDNVYSGYSNCTTFNSASVNNSQRLEIFIGDVNDGCADVGTGSGAYGIQFNISQDVYSSIANGSAANLSFIWSFNDSINSLDDADEASIKVTIGNGTIIAYEDFESREFGTSNIDTRNFQGGFGWLYDWSVAGDYVVAGGDENGGLYSLRLQGFGSAERALNLSGYSNPVLQVRIRAQSIEVGDIANLSISSDGINYITLEQWIDGDDDNIYHLYEYNLAKYTTLSPELWILFNSEFNDGAGDNFFVDDILIQEGTVNYLGSAMDTSDFADITNEVMWWDNPVDNLTGNDVLYNIANYITAPGQYYLTLGGKLHQWGNGEWAEFYFDNISLMVDN